MRRLLYGLAGVIVFVAGSRADAQYWRYPVVGGPGWGYGWYEPYPVYPRPIILPPLYLPAETMYGPQAVRRFMGLDQPMPVPRTYIVNRAAPEPAAPKSKVRVSNEETKAQAARFIKFGDEHFAKQNYNSALERYRSAVVVAPDVADAFLRQGLAQIAMGNYDSASRVVRRALTLQPEADRWTWRLNDVYGENRVAKSAHLEALAAAVEEKPDDANLLLLLGVFLYFDGDFARARPLLQLCSRMGGNSDGVITSFLKALDKPPARAKDI